MKPPIKVIVLNRPERLNNYYTNISKYYSNIDIFNAIDCNTTQIEEWFKNHPEIKVEFVPYLTKQVLNIEVSYPCMWIRRGLIAYILSTIELWEYMIKNNIPNMIIMQDDLILYSEFENDIEKLLNELPPDFEFINLFTHSKFIERLDKSPKIADKNYKKLSTTWGVDVAYCISLSGAKKLLKKFQTIYNPIDIQLCHIFQSNDIKVYSAYPPLIKTLGQEDMNENIDKIPSSIWTSEIYNGMSYMI